MKKFLKVPILFFCLGFYNMLTAQSAYYTATINNNTSCNVIVTFMDGGLNVLYSTTVNAGTTPTFTCQSGPCNWISFDAGSLSCPITIPATGGANANYVGSCGVCCTPVCVPLSTIDIFGYNFMTQFSCGTSPDLTDIFRVDLN